MRAAIFITIAAIIIVAFSCSNERGGFFSRLLKGGGSGVPVTVESVVSDESPEIISVSATIDPAETVDIPAPADVTVERILVADGDRVNAGDPVARISEDEINNRLTRLRSDMRDAQATLEKDSYVMRNRDRLLEEERIDRQQYEALDGQVAADEANVDKIKQDISKLEAKIGNTVITTPLGGIVSRRSSPTVSQAGAPLLSITRINPATATFRLKSEQTTIVKTGMPAKVILPVSGTEPVEGTISSVDPKIDPADRTFAVQVQVPNAQGFFKSGMRVEVDFEGPKMRRTYLIPRDALIRDQRDYFVYTVSKGVAHKVQVIPERMSGSQIEISRGLSDEDMVVVRGQDKLAEGTVVDIWRK